MRSKNSNKKLRMIIALDEEDNEIAVFGSNKPDELGPMNKYASKAMFD